MTARTPEQRQAAAHWREVVSPYKGADNRRSLRQLLTTLLCFFASWGAMFWALEISYLLSLVLAVPTGLFLVRLFMIQHDCGHGSYFSNRKAADTVGFCIGVLTLTPYTYWRKTHAYHHAHPGDLDFRGFGDILTLTRAEYEALSFRGKLKYRLYRNPFVLLGIGPAFHFLVKHRYPWDIPNQWRSVWKGVWATNAAIVALVLLMGWLVGFGTFFALQIPVTLVACSVGVWLFYVQHQFEETYWTHHEEWDYYDAAIKGSSHLVLPKPFQWLTANIGLHHVHHLNATIPNYRLQECLDSSKDLQEAVQIRMSETFSLLKLTLWDEDQQRMITFRDLRKMRAAANA